MVTPLWKLRATPPLRKFLKILEKLRPLGLGEGGRIYVLLRYPRTKDDYKFLSAYWQHVLVEAIIQRIVNGL